MRKLRKSDDTLPGIFTLDFSKVVFIDLSGLYALVEVLLEGRNAGVQFHFINVRKNVLNMIEKFGIEPDFKDHDSFLQATYSYTI